MLHLPQSHSHENQGLGQGPPKDTLVCAVTSLAEALFTVLKLGKCVEICIGRFKSDPTYSLVVLLLGNLVHLVQQLPDTKLQLGEFLFLSNVGIVDGMLADLDVEVDTQLRSAEPSRAVGVHADYVLAGGVRSERNATLRAVHTGQDGLVVRIFHLDVHADPRRRWHKSAATRIVQFYLVVYCK